MIVIDYKSLRSLKKLYKDNRYEFYNMFFHKNNR